MRRFSASVLALALSITRYRLAVMAALSPLALLVLPGCSNGGTTSGPMKASTASPSSHARQTYASKAFILPLTVTVDASLKSPPNPDSPHLLSWDAASSPANKVRFLVPVNLYRPDSAAPEAPPKHYLSYLQRLTGLGAQLSNMTKITVDGHPATLMSATSTTAHGWDGSLGCLSTGADQDEGCFGIQPDLILRIAVIPVGNTTLLAWARTDKANPDEAFFVMFERMLKSVQFR